MFKAEYKIQRSTDTNLGVNKILFLLEHIPHLSEVQYNSVTSWRVQIFL